MENSVDNKALVALKSVMDNETYAELLGAGGIVIRMTQWRKLGPIEKVVLVGGLVVIVGRILFRANKAMKPTT